MKQWQSISEHIEQTTGRPFSVGHQQLMGGGSINDAFLLTGENGQQYFVKTNRTGKKAMFEAEALGLQEIASSHTIKVPKSVCVGENQAQSYIVLEYLDMTGRADQQLLGEQLAAMHHNTAEQFGWKINNTIGATFQPNDWMDDWLRFWSEQRLGFILKLAAHIVYGG
jgi:protein-ribulosamine 3-kinase